MEIDYNKHIDRHNNNDCYCNTGIDPVYTEEGIVCMNCGYTKDIIYSCYEDSGDNTVQSYLGNNRDDLYSEAFNMRTTTSDNALNQKLLRMYITYEDTVLFDIKKILEEKSHNLNLSKCIIDSALHYFKNFINHRDKNGDKTIYKGQNKITIIAVCLYYACRDYDSINYIESDICSLFGINQKLFEEYSQLFCKKTNYQIDKNMSIDDIIKNICSKINLSSKYTTICLKITSVINVFDLLADVSYRNKCLGIVFFVITEASLNYTKEMYIDKFKITHITLNKILRILKDNKTFIFNVIKEKYN